MSDSPRSPLWRHADFRRLWIGQTISDAGSMVSYLAIPLVAVLVLRAGAFEVGLLSTFEYLPFLLFGLPAGVWVDRLPHRAVMIVADSGRALALGSIPLVSFLGHLTLAQLYAAGFVTGVLTVFFDVAYQSYLPSLVGRDRLVEGNSRLEFTRATTEIAGPGVGGLLVRALGAPLAVAADAASFLASVLSLAMIRTRPSLSSPSRQSSLWRELREGFGYVVRHRILRSVAGCTASYNLVANGINAILILFAVRDLGLSPAIIGLWFALGSVTSPVGALLASRLVQRVGTGHALILTACVEAVAWIPIAAAPRAFPLPLLILSGLIGGPMGVAYNIVQVSMRQAITPRGMLGRMNATVRFFMWGTIPLGAFLGGVLGTLIGLRAAIAVFAAAGLLSPLPLVFSPLRQMRDATSLPPPGDADLALETAR